MLWKRIARYWKNGSAEINIKTGRYLYALYLPFILLVAAGCGNASLPNKDDTSDYSQVVQISEQPNIYDAEQIAETYRNVYEKAVETDTLGSLEVTQNIVNRLGENGYVAVDSENQINMTGSRQVVEFCKQVTEKEEAELTIIVVSYLGGFTKYNLKTQAGNVDIVQETYQYEGEKLAKKSEGSYSADIWKYTEEGYLIFSGSWFSEEYYTLSLSGVEEHIALRVQPIDEKCREMNRKYVSWIGYGKNNMFISDWSEKDFAALDFYDLYDIFYPTVANQSNPYVPDDNLGVGAVYEIPKSEFENVIMTYLNIDSLALQSKTSYFTEREAYEYKPRGFYEAEYPEIPYPEVVGYVENIDGTITLTVNAVYPNGDTSRLFAHEVVIRTLDDGGFQYVSNRVIAIAEENEMWWHTERLTEEEWEKIYEKTGDTMVISGREPGGAGVAENISEQVGKGYNLPINDSDRKEAETDCKNVMEMVQDIYINADKGQSVNTILSEESIITMQQKLKETGCPVTTNLTYSNMENYQAMECFLIACSEGENGSVVMYDIHSDGGVGRYKYVFDGATMYVIYANVKWNKDINPTITYISNTRIKEWSYTDKGWFCYEVCVPQPPEVSEIVDGSCMVRIKPMEREYMEISKKCVLPLSYHGNNLLCSNWDTENLEELDYNGMYEFLYNMKYQKKFNYEDYSNGIPKEEFESLIMEYIPVTAEQIQAYAVFDEEHKTYAWAQQSRPSGFFGASVPEVTAIKENGDGTVTLTVDAVCEMVLCDDAVITHKLTVRFAEDGSFKYLGNEILGEGVKNIPDYQYRISGK